MVCLKNEVVVQVDVHNYSVNITYVHLLMNFLCNFFGKQVFFLYFCD